MWKDLASVVLKVRAQIISYEVINIPRSLKCVAKKKRPNLKCGKSLRQIILTYGEFQMGFVLIFVGQ